jgi:hypothetical protein
VVVKGQNAPHKGEQMGGMYDEMVKVKNEIRLNDNVDEVHDLLRVFLSDHVWEAMDKAMTQLFDARYEAQIKLLDEIRKINGNGRLSVRTRTKLRIRNYITEINRNAFIINTTKINKKNASIKILQLIVLSTSTPKGLVYFVALPTSSKQLNIRAFYSHLFDRFSKRGHDNNLNRRAAIVKFFAELAPVDTDKAEEQYGFSAVNTETAEVLEFAPMGVLLGSVSSFSPQKSPDRVVSLSAYKTFITYDMLRGEQNELHEMGKKGSKTHGPWRFRRCIAVQQETN